MKGQDNMGGVAVLLVIVVSLLVGFAYQWLGHAREKYEWAIGGVGALYGGLLAYGIAQSVFGGTAVDTLPLELTAVGAILGGGLTVFGVRAFSRGRSSMRPSRTAAHESIRRTVRLSYSPDLLREAAIYSMVRQFGVEITIGDVEISSSRGWLEIDVVGAPAAVDAALGLARRGGVELTLANLPERPSLSAAA